MTLVTTLCLVQVILAGANLFMLARTSRRLNRIREAERRLMQFADLGPKPRPPRAWLEELTRELRGPSR